MSEPLSRSQVDKLGHRLRAGSVGDDDIRLLDSFKGTVMFRTAELAMRVDDVVRDNLWDDYTKRRQKTNPSIVQKLRRSSTSLSRMQDISACRIVFPTLPDLTDDAWDQLARVLGDHRAVDRIGTNHAGGYRAVHLIAHVDYFQYEVQLRTRLQHAWAELSEKLADRFGQGLKYGAGPPEQSAFLLGLSREIESLESDEIDDVKGYVSTAEGEDDPDALEGPPERRARRAAILHRIAQARRFL